MKYVLNFCPFVFISLVSAAEWQPLIDEKLTQWEIWTGVPHTSVEVEWNGKADKPADGKPMGLGDPLKIYSTEKLDDGSYALKISGQVYAGLTSKKTYSKYHLSGEVKWGKKKWEPRLKKPRDSGILYHCHGEHGTFWNVWKSGLEYQVQENDNGDYFKIGGVKVDIPVDDPSKRRACYTPGGTWTSIFDKGRYSVQRSENFETAGEWNKVEVIVVGDRAVHLSNGKVVNVLKNAKYRANGGWASLTVGQIQIQSEGAQVTYRNLKIKELKSMPIKYRALFKESSKP